MSFIELLIILLVAIGIIDKNKIQKIFKTLANLQNGPTRQIIGDQSLEEIKNKHSDILESINKDKELSEDNAAKLKSFFDDFLKRFTNN